MKPPSTSVVALVVFAFITASATAQTATNRADVYFPHEHVQKFTVTDPDLPFEKQLVMKEHDAVIFILPQQRSLSVWCYKPDDFFPLAEQTTKSGLKTDWGEKPWIKPRMKYKSIGGNSYTGNGLDSYIELGGVVTTVDRQSDYTLYVDRLKVSIIENLSSTNTLPVKIRVEKTDRQPQQDGAANGSQPRVSESGQRVHCVGYSTGETAWLAESEIAKLQLRDFTVLPKIRP
jgi:hypothetical protein